MRTVLTRVSGLMLFVLIMNSCAGLHQLVPQSSVSLDRGNFKYVKFVEAEETSIYVFGIGGMSRKARNTNAYNKLVEKAELTSNQAIANVSIRRNTHLYFPVGIVVTSVTTIASGWVIEFEGEADSKHAKEIDVETGNNGKENATATIPTEKEETINTGNSKDVKAASLTKAVIHTSEGEKKLLVEDTMENNYSIAKQSLDIVSEILAKGGPDAIEQTERNLTILEDWMDKVKLSRHNRNLVKADIIRLKKKIEKAKSIK